MVQWKLKWDIDAQSSPNYSIMHYNIVHTVKHKSIDHHNAVILEMLVYNKLTMTVTIMTINAVIMIDNIIHDCVQENVKD